LHYNGSMDQGVVVSANDGVMEWCAELLFHFWADIGKRERS